MFFGGGCFTLIHTVMYIRLTINTNVRKTLKKWYAAFREKDNQIPATKPRGIKISAYPESRNVSY